jgi:peptidoglycan/xylan/chitin deacetylase (PgdA/CDA1 family)
MKYKTLFLPLILIIPLLGGCQSISRGRAELGISRPTVLLSFDDGPNAHEDTTARLLDTLNQYDVQAIFALLGENAEQNPALVRRIHAEGHLIVNHGYYDKWACGMSDAEFRDNLLRGEAAITAALGEPVRPKLYRPQGGFYTARQEKILAEAGYSLMNGSIRVYDAVLDRTKGKKVVAQLVKMVEQRGGGLILLHDARDSHFRMEAELAKNPAGPFNRGWIPGAVEELIQVLLEKGYHFESPQTALTPQPEPAAGRSPS